ncbi:protein of unknown function [Methylacidimicrobium sp. AP8]|nr:protein of unknown function [Methylacidimicrobium sp. AP8]
MAAREVRLGRRRGIGIRERGSTGASVSSRSGRLRGSGGALRVFRLCRPHRVKSRGKAERFDGYPPYLTNSGHSGGQKSRQKGIGKAVFPWYKCVKKTLLQPEKRNGLP